MFETHFFVQPWPNTAAQEGTSEGPRHNDRYNGPTVDYICSVFLYGISTGVYAASVAGVEFECSVVEYPSFIANLPTLQEPHYVLYTAATDDATQQPWCPDCQQADPIIEEVIKKSGGTLLKVKVS